MHLPGSFPVLLQLGHVGDSGRCARSAWCWASPERSSWELLSSEARGWHQEPAGFGKSLSAGVSGAPGREMLLAGAGGTAARGSRGLWMCKEPGQGAALIPPCSKESLMCWEGAQRPQPKQGRGYPPTASSGGCNSLFYPFKYPKKEILELEEMRNVPSIQNVSYKTSGVAGASRGCFCKVPASPESSQCWYWGY